MLRREKNIKNGKENTLFSTETPYEEKKKKKQQTSEKACKCLKLNSI